MKCFSLRGGRMLRLVAVLAGVAVLSIPQLSEASRESKKSERRHNKISRLVDRSLKKFGRAVELTHKSPDATNINFRIDFINHSVSSGLRIALSQLDGSDGALLKKTKYAGILREMEAFLAESSLLRNFIFEGVILKSSDRNIALRKMKRSEKIMSHARRELLKIYTPDTTTQIDASSDFKKWVEDARAEEAIRLEFFDRMRTELAACTQIKQVNQIRESFERAMRLATEYSRHLDTVQGQNQMLVTIPGMVSASASRSDAIMQNLISFAQTTGSVCPGFAPLLEVVPIPLTGPCISMSVGNSPGTLSSGIQSSSYLMPALGQLKCMAPPLVIGLSFDGI